MTAHKLAVIVCKEKKKHQQLKAKATGPVKSTVRSRKVYKIARDKGCFVLPDRIAVTTMPMPSGLFTQSCRNLALDGSTNWMWTCRPLRAMLDGITCVAWLICRLIVRRRQSQKQTISSLSHVVNARLTLGIWSYPRDVVAFTNFDNCNMASSKHWWPSRDGQFARLDARLHYRVQQRCSTSVSKSILEGNCHGWLLCWLSTNMFAVQSYPSTLPYIINCKNRARIKRKKTSL